MSTAHNSGEVLLIDEEECLVLIDGQEHRVDEHSMELLDWNLEAAHNADRRVQVYPSIGGGE